MAQPTGGTFRPDNPAAVGPDNLNAPAIPAAVALPVETGTGSAAPDASANRKFYTLTASLREIYDDNVNTSDINKQSSLETQVSPSILVSFPKEDSNFSARYTLNATYYSQRPNFLGSDIETTHEFVAQYSHSFTDRFNLNVAELFRYYYEPGILESTGTPFQNGAYISNIASGTFSAQWTPLVGSTTSFSNTIVDYEQASVADFQNSVENTGTQSISFAILPKINLNFGFTGDDISYKTDLRGYTSYTGFTGVQWQALPSISLSVQAGGSYTETVDSQTQITPYAALSLSWQLGKRSSLSFSYAHEVAPTDQAGANAETVDRLSAGLNYDISTFLTANLQGIYTNEEIPGSFVLNGQTVSPNEQVYEVDAGLTYHYNSYLDFNGGVTVSGVESEITFNKYERNQLYLGIRGTY